MLHSMPPVDYVSQHWIIIFRVNVGYCEIREISYYDSTNFIQAKQKHYFYYFIVADKFKHYCIYTIMFKLICHNKIIKIVLLLSLDKICAIIVTNFPYFTIPNIYSKYYYPVLTNIVHRRHRVQHNYVRMYAYVALHYIFAKFCSNRDRQSLCSIRNFIILLWQITKV